MKKLVRQKRYEYFTKGGKAWSEWFSYDGEEYPFQLGKKLRNEYRTIEIEEDSPHDLEQRSLSPSRKKASARPRKTPQQDRGRKSLRGGAWASLYPSPKRTIGRTPITEGSLFPE